jgi:hypothetical protein
VAKRTYSQEEVDAILERAIAQQQAESAGLSHEDLVSAAGEVGISKAAIDAAAREVASGTPAPSSDAQVVRAWKKRAWRGFIKHFTTFVLVNTMLAFVNIATSTAFLWFPIVILGWGIGVAMQLLGIVLADEERIVERERRKAERRARRERWKAKGADFEHAVTEGVRMLLETATEHRRRPVAASERPGRPVAASERPGRRVAEPLRVADAPEAEELPDEQQEVRKRRATEDSNF